MAFFFFSLWYAGKDSNLHTITALVPKTSVSTNSTTRASSVIASLTSFSALQKNSVAPHHLLFPSKPSLRFGFCGSPVFKTNTSLTSFSALQKNFVASLHLLFPSKPARRFEFCGNPVLQRAMLF